MTVFAAALRTLHAHPNGPVPADYRRGGQGPAARVRVVHTILEPSRAPFGMQLKARADQLQVRLSDAPHLAQSDTFTMDPDGAPWIAVVTSVELDAEGLSATCIIRRM
jgi:hypothetical protein